MSVHYMAIDAELFHCWNHFNRHKKKGETLAGDSEVADEIITLNLGIETLTLRKAPGVG